MASDKQNLSGLRCAPAPCTRHRAQRHRAQRHRAQRWRSQARSRDACQVSANRATSQAKSDHPAKSGQRQPRTKSASQQVRALSIDRALSPSQRQVSKSAPSQQVSAKSDYAARGARRATPPGGGDGGGLLRATPSPAVSAMSGKTGCLGVFGKNRRSRRVSEKSETDVRRRSNKRSGPKFFAVNFFENRVGCWGSQRGDYGGT